MQSDDQTRQEFERWADSISLRTATVLDDGRTYGNQHTHIAWMSWQAAYAAGLSAGLEEAAQIAEHFSVDELNPEEFPEYGLAKASERGDNMSSEKTGAYIAAAILKRKEGK